MSIQLTTTEMFRPNLDRCVGGPYRGNHTGYHVGITREGDRVTVTHAWGHSFHGFANREERTYSIEREIASAREALDSLNGDGEPEFTLSIVDDLPEGFSQPEWMP